MGAAGLMLDILGGMAAEEGPQDDGSTDDPGSAQQAACDRNFAQAHRANERGRAATNPDDAIAEFQQAISLLRRCGDNANIAKVSKNIERVRADWAALTRPSSAKNVIGGTTPREPALHRAQLFSQAKAQCAHAEGQSWQACVHRRQGDLLLASYRGIRAACQSVPDPEARSRCAHDRYLALSGASAASKQDENCYFDERGRPCFPGGAGVRRQAKQDSASRLRDELRAKLRDLPDTLPADPTAKKISDAEAARDALDPGPERDRITAMIDKAKAQKSLNDQAHDNYMQSGNSHSGGKNDGTLGMKGVNVGVPEKGSFANDLGGDKLLGSPVPSRR